jgi:hypothetical protein
MTKRDESKRSPHRPIWEVVQEIAASVPAQEWERVPPDLSVRLDYYLYEATRDED